MMPPHYNRKKECRHTSASNHPQLNLLLTEDAPRTHCDGLDDVTPRADARGRRGR
jgi:hypothetical protein